MLFEGQFRYVCNGCSTQAQANSLIGPYCRVCNVVMDFRSQGGYRYTMDVKAKTVKIISQRPF